MCRRAEIVRAIAPLCSSVRVRVCAQWLTGDSAEEVFAYSSPKRVRRRKRRNGGAEWDEEERKSVRSGRITVTQL